VRSCAVTVQTNETAELFNTGGPDILCDGSDGEITIDIIIENNPTVESLDFRCAESCHHVITTPKRTARQCQSGGAVLAPRTHMAQPVTPGLYGMATMYVQHTATL
jgi:hypothetical protein